MAGCTGWCRAEEEKEEQEEQERAASPRDLPLLDTGDRINLQYCLHNNKQFFFCFFYFINKLKFETRFLNAKLWRVKL